MYIKLYRSWYLLIQSFLYIYIYIYSTYLYGFLYQALCVWLGIEKASKIGTTVSQAPLASDPHKSRPSIYKAFIIIILYIINYHSNHYCYCY